MIIEDEYEGSRSGLLYGSRGKGFLLFSGTSGREIFEEFGKMKEGHLTNFFLCVINLSAVSHD